MLGDEGGPNDRHLYMWVHLVALHFVSSFIVFLYFIFLTQDPCPDLPVTVLPTAVQITITP